MERAFKCDICSEKFISQSKLNHHISREHGKPAVLPKKRFDCNVCDKKLSTNQALIDHMKTHTGEQPFKCTAQDCGKAFALNKTLKNHMRTHTGERSFKCTAPDCGEAFAGSGNLRTHMRIHANERPFKCLVTDCQMDFKYQSNLEVHIKYKHLRDRLESIHIAAYNICMLGGDNSKCSHPERTDSLICSYDQERLLGNQDEESTTQCDDQPGCEKTLANADALDNAILCADSEQSLVCHILKCSYRTSTAEDLLAHMFEHIERNENDFCSTETG